MRLIDPKQLKMGEKEEGEHHLSSEETRQIALDHLKKIPDYYTRLEKMEEAAPHINLDENEMNKNPILAAIKKRKNPDIADEKEEESKEPQAEEKTESPLEEGKEETQENEAPNEKKKKIFGALIALKMKKK